VDRPFSPDFRSSREPRPCAAIPEIMRLWTMRMKNAYPCINMVCQNCGHTMLFNAAVLDLLPEGKS
jgi:hypothetical protein